MIIFPDQLKTEIREIHEEVKDFSQDPDFYGVVTLSGFFIDIAKCRTIQPGIKNPDDFHAYMLLSSSKGCFLLRQRFKGGLPMPWFVEIEMIPEEKSAYYFDGIMEFISENTEFLEELCGPPHQ